MKSHTNTEKCIKEIEVKMLLGTMNVQAALAELRILGEFRNVR